MCFRPFLTVHTNKIWMLFRSDPLSRAFANRCGFDENARRISLDGRPKRIEMYAFSNENALMWTGHTSHFFKPNLKSLSRSHIWAKLFLMGQVLLIDYLVRFLLYFTMKKHDTEKPLFKNNQTNQWTGWDARSGVVQLLAFMGYVEFSFCTIVNGMCEMCLKNNSKDVWGVFENFHWAFDGNCSFITMAESHHVTCK